MGDIVAQILTGLSNASALFFVASGLSLIFGVTRIVNLAHGSLYMLGAYGGYSLAGVMPGVLSAVLPDAIAGHVGFWGAVVLAAVLVGVVGALMEVIVLRPVYGAPALVQLVVTFGVVLVVQDVALMLWGAEDLLGPRAPGLEGAVFLWGAAIPTYDLALIALTPVLVCLLWYVMTRTRFGLLVRAATQDREMLAALGVNQAWLFTGVVFTGAMLAGLGGALQLPKGGATLLMDMNIIATAFVVVVVGGMGSLMGALLASVLIAVLGMLGVRYMPESTLVLTFIIMAAVLLLRPQGLLGAKESAHVAAETPAMPLRPFGKKGRAVVLGLMALLVLLPVVRYGAGSEFILVLMTDVLVFCLFAASLHFMISLGGLVSFGHAAFYGGGAYAAALLVQHAGAPMEAALLFAPLCAGVLALGIGALCLRLEGIYFAMLTLAFAQFLWSVAMQWTDITGGDDGIIGLWPSPWAADITVYYYMTLTLSVGGMAVLRRVAHAPFGYALRAARDCPLRAYATGIPVKHVQWVSMGLAGALGGAAGGLFVFSKGSVFPTELEIERSFDALMMVFLGGVHSLSGPILGAGGLTVLKDIISRFDYWRMVLGAVIIVIVIVAPGGIASIMQRWQTWWRASR